MRGKYTKSKKAIRNTFVTLIKTKEINNISVSEITRNADVSRGTFYLHYKDVDDLYNDIEDEVYEKLSSLFDSYYQSKENLDLDNLITSLIEFIYDSKETFLAITTPAHIDRTLNRLRDFCYKRMVFPSYEKQTIEYQKTRAIFISNGVVGVLSNWILGGMHLDKKVLTDELKNIISQIR